MDVDEPQQQQQQQEAGGGDAEQQPAKLNLVLPLLQTIKTAQLQNGLKHGDFARYRQYCARRLRSLYVALRFLHGKGRYTRRKLDVQHVTDARYLQIVLVSAERAWAHAMQLKREGEGEDYAARKRHYAARRLKKAAAWAAELARLANAACDTRSALEAEAYASWMAANVLMESERDWPRALALFTRAKTLFAELARVAPDHESQALCGAMVEELGPALRYCSYQHGRATGGEAPDAEALLQMADSGELGGGGLLQSKLASLAAEAQATRAASTSSFEWRGVAAGVPLERIRVPLHSAAELAASLEQKLQQQQEQQSEQQQQPEQQQQQQESLLPLFDRLTNLYGEARAAARAAAKAASAGAARVGEAELVDEQELRALDTALSGRILEVALARGESAARDAAARFEAAMARAVAGGGGGGGKGGRGGGGKDRDGGRPPRPEDLVRLYGGLCQHAAELEELSSHMGGRAGEALAASAAARQLAYAAHRACYAGHASLAAGRWADAAALFRLAGERCGKASEALEDLPKGGEQAARALLPGLAVLAVRAKGYLTAACAEAAAEQEAAAADAAAGVAGVSLADEGAAEEEAADDDGDAGGKRAKGGKRRGASASGSSYRNLRPARWMVDHMGEFESFAGPGGGKGVRLINPLQLTPILPPPIMLDSAVSELRYPDLTHRFTARRGGGAGGGGGGEGGEGAAGAVAGAVAGTAAAASAAVSRLFGGWGS